MKCLCVNGIFGVHLAFGSIHHTFHTSLNLWCFVQRRRNHKWKQTWLLSGALAFRNQITAEKLETEISVITSVGVILMKPWKVASFQGQWGEIRSDFSAFFPYGQANLHSEPSPHSLSRMSCWANEGAGQAHAWCLVWAQLSIHMQIQAKGTKARRDILAPIPGSHSDFAYLLCIFFHTLHI